MREETHVTMVTAGVLLWHSMDFTTKETSLWLKNCSRTCACVYVRCVYMCVYSYQYIHVVRAYVCGRVHAHMSMFANNALLGGGVRG